MTASALNRNMPTGIDVIDREHYGLMELIDQLSEIATRDESPNEQQVREVLATLMRRAEEHFDHESGLMDEAGCSARHVEHHRREHVEFLRQVTLMAATEGLDSEGGVTALVQYLSSWMAHHTLSQDQSLARQLAAIAAGATPTEAFERELPLFDPQFGTLVAALGNMAALVASRNIALAEAQGMLRRANLALEANVDARTRDLEAANATLTATVERLEQAQQQLLHSEKMASIGQLAAGVAHEINNPVGFVNSNLGTLGGYVETLLALLERYIDEEEHLAPPARERLQAARQTAELDYLRTDIVDLVRESQDGLERVTAIVQDLKEFSHIDNKEWELADLNTGMDSTLNVVWNEIKYKAEVIKEYGDLPLILCLPSQLNQVFMNLLVNAAQAIEGMGTITLRSGVDDGRVWMEVEDSGKGMSADVQKRIFEPFFTTKPIGKGTGLGLSLAYGIVQKHQGDIQLVSAPGRGSRFRVYVPIRDPDDDVPQGV